MFILPEPLAPLRAYAQFILYKLVPGKMPGKMDKLPVDPNSFQVFRKGENWQQNPQMWTTSDNAAQAAFRLGPEYGVGFFFTPSDPFFFVDVDDCLQGDSWSPIANDLMTRFNGAAVEISQSGRGLHIFGQYAGPAPDHGCKNIPHSLELYTSGRFVALTGNGAVGSAGTDCTTALLSAIQTYYPPKTVDAGTVAAWTAEAAEGYTGPVDDDALIAAAMKSESIGAKFGSVATFRQLWEADEDALSKFYPDQRGRAYDSSSADLALIQHLAFWTGKNCERMDRIVRRSGLVREKWDREDYLPRTILSAVAMQKSIYNIVAPADEPPPVPVEVVPEPFGNIENGPEFPGGKQYMAETQQAELFKECVYIQDIHRVFIPSGTLLKAEQFNATYGGFSFDLDGTKTTKKAFEAFTESQVVRYPKAETACFRPLLAAGSLLEEEGRVLVNTYVPAFPNRKQGDPSRFLLHLGKLLPDARDREILLSYMAAVVQHKGVKFQWAPLLQGTPGNGKTLFTRCVAKAIGKKYVHLPKAANIGEKFNAWLFNKIFIGVEDIFVSGDRQEIFEILKDMITGEELEERAMQQNQIMRDLCCNFIFNSNHQDAVRKTRDDRRLSIFFTAQQHAEEVIRDGMGGDYFPDLYDWLKNDDGYAIVSEYLHTYQICEEFNPAGACHRAPETSTTDQAIAASLGGVEQEILEAIDEGRPGFAGGWVSSMALEMLLRNKRKDGAIHINKRREVLRSMGYDYHPALNNGRVNNTVSPDGGKPRLFIKAGHPALMIATAGEVAKSYSMAQSDTTGVKEAFG